MKKYGPVILTVILLVSWGFSRHNAEGGIKRRSVELTFWHSMSIYQGDTLEQLVEEYNNNNEDIQVRLIFQGLYDDMKIKLINAVKTGDLPDVSQVAIEYLDVFIDDNRIEPITDYISEDDKNDILSQFWNGVTRQREIYAFPFNHSVQVLYYNKDAFEKAGLDPDKPPKTWEDVIKYGKKLTKDFDGDGTIDQWGILVSLEGVFGFTPLIRQVGGEFLNDDRTKALFNSEEGVRVMELVQKMAYEYKIMPSNWTLFEGTSAFLQGKIAMGPITCAGIKFAEDNLPWELGIAPLPYIENKSVLLGGAGLVIFSKSSHRRKAAMNFISWLTNKENSIRWHEKTGYLPIRKSAMESFELQSFHRLNPNYKVPVDQLSYSRPPDFTPYLPQIDQIVRYAIEDIMINRKDPQKTLNIAAEKVNNLLKEEE
ncbi:MAG: ABC transporter substrate-binding protein [Spirochaetes bacterium]|nr:ABC transporter substrate-binding protein [Spirochaetota bacterium]